LKVYSADHLGTTTASLLQLELITEKVEVGRDTKECLTEVDKDKDVKNSIWVEIAQTDYP